MMMMVVVVKNELKASVHRQAWPIRAHHHSEMLQARVSARVLASISNVAFVEQHIGLISGGNK